MTSQIIKSEADRLNLFPPKIEDADKMTPMELLIELFKRGYTTVPLDKSSHAYVLPEKKDKEEESNEIIKLPSNTNLEAKLRQNQQQEKNPVY